jgi:hypothetical protein
MLSVAAIAGSIAEPIFGEIPPDTLAFVWPRLNEKLQSVIREFVFRFELQHLSALR